MKGGKYIKECDKILKGEIRKLMRVRKVGEGGIRKGRSWKGGDSTGKLGDEFGELGIGRESEIL